MKIIADLHTHSLASQHAYSTIAELAQAAKERGFQAFAVTDHGPQMPDGAISHHFFCMKGNMPDYIQGLRFYKGAEVNIMDYAGTIDLEPAVLKRLDFVIASYHSECIKPSSREEHTRGLLQVIQNPYVDCIGHCGNPAYEIDVEPVVDACKEHHKILEINSSSFRIRPGSERICSQAAALCAKKGVPIIVSSDAHSMWFVGEHSDAIAMLEKIHFPKELVLNADLNRLQDYFSGRDKRLSVSAPL